MKFLPVLLASTTCFLPKAAWSQTPSRTAATQPSTKPNIILIFADDMGFKDTGFTGSDFFETPNIDRLAKQGMIFNAAYAGAANCAPSRACLISGQYTPRHGVYAVGSTNRGPKKQQRLVPIPNKGGLAPSVVTVAEALREGGYATAIFGKWHLSGQEGAPPAQQGFETVFDAVKEGKANGTDEEEGRNVTGPPDNPKYVFANADAAGDFIEKETKLNKPFFAYLAHDAVHAPWGSRPETLARFQAKAQGRGKVKGIDQSNARYGACIYDFDESVGRVLKTVKDLGIENNTLIIFTSDNGGVNGNGMSQEPLRGNKGGYYEGGIRVPMWAIWPGVIKPGTTCNEPVINIDFFPTFLQVGKTPVPAGTVLDGESLLPLFKGERKLKRQEIFWHFPGYLNNPVNRGRDPLFRTRPVSTIRKGDWKLLLYHEEWKLDGGREKLATNHAVELYNLASDGGERTDLANESPVKRDELLGDLLAWMDRTQAPMPFELNRAYVAERN